MPFDDRDLSYLWDMRKYALEIAEIISEVPHTKFVENKTTRYAVERLLLIVGEAANHVRRSFRRNILKLNGRKSLACEMFWRMNMAK